MIRTRGLLLVVVMGSSLALSCKDKPAENAVDASAAAVTVAPAASSAAPLASAGAADAAASATAEPQARGAHRGPNAMLFQAAHALDLKDDVKAKVDAAESAGHAEDPKAADAMKDAGKELHTELIAGVKAGKIDTAKIEPRYAALEKVMTAEHEKEASALNALHDALDATQRKAVVASVRAKQAVREEKMAERAKEHGDAGVGDGGKPNMGKRHLDNLTRGLDLDADQQKKIDALAPKDDGKTSRPDPAEMKKRVETLLTAFEKDTFDAKKVDMFDVKRMRTPMEAETKLLGQILPILKPEQREKLAAKMEKGPSPHGRRGGFGQRPTMFEEEEHEGDWN